MFVNVNLHALSYFWFFALNVETIVVCLHLLIATLAGGHALLYKKDQRAALGWLSVCVLFPLAGSALYYTFGINRVRNRAHGLTGKKFWRLVVPLERGEGKVRNKRSTALREPNFPNPLPTGISQIINISDAITDQNLLSGNHVTILENGDQAYPEMLDAIHSAQSSILLMSYILRRDSAGKRFIEAMKQAAARGVDVYVVIDGIGDFYGWPRASKAFGNSEVNVARFIPPRIIPPSFLINLRNHRKLMVVDGNLAFTGGMNIDKEHCIGDKPSSTGIRDLHFAVQGPVVADMTKHFCETWQFITHEPLQIHSTPTVVGDSACRLIIDGPDDNMDKLHLILVGAISAAQRSIDIMTPYFIPSREMISALAAAALRGIEIRIILPEKSNLRFVDWATRNMIWELLQWDVQIYYQPVPFTHTKLFVVDEEYAVIGSANIDPRSLRLNFELCLEVFDRDFSELLKRYCDVSVSLSRSLSQAEVENRALPVRARDAICWLFSPYL
ncbi:MAG: cardiolipin synthase [Candidatus Azotimanducaceae bacterium]